MSFRLGSGYPRVQIWIQVFLIFLIVTLAEQKYQTLEAQDFEPGNDHLHHHFDAELTALVGSMAD
jgi:hypothetical protein